MPLCLAWRGHPAIINPSDTGHVRRKTDRLDAEKLAQHSLCGLWRESWMAPDEIQELRVLANQRSKLVAEPVGSPTGSTAICSASVMWSGSWARSTGPSSAP